MNTGPDDVRDTSLLDVLGSEEAVVQTFLDEFNAVRDRRGGVGVVTRLLNAQQAGELLGVPASWVLEQARKNRIPHVRLGRYVRFDPDALDAWWRNRLQGGGGRVG